MKDKLCVYTCITGDYDNLHEIEHPEKNIDYYCFTNNKSITSKTWKIVYIENGGLDNCRLARKIKILGHQKINQYKIAVWSDADVIWQKSITSFVQKYFKGASLSIFKHHVRDNIYDEAIACLRLRKDSKDIIQKTLSFYKTAGYPDDNGLCESTVYIKNPQDPKVTKTMKVWFDMIKNYSRRDQLSFNYAVWKTDLRVKYIPIGVWSNQWFYTTKHTPSQEIKDCHVYFGNPEQNFNFAKYQVYDLKKKGDTYQFSTTIPNDTTEIEFNPTNIIGTEFKNIVIKPNPNHINIHSAITINDQKMFFCNDHGTIQAYSKFKKGQKLSFSITMLIPTDNTYNKIIDYQWFSLLGLQIKSQSLQKEINLLQNENSQLRDTLQNITNSKSWRIFKKLQLLTSFFSKK